MNITGKLPCLAIVTNSCETPQNIGKIVSVIRRANYGDIVGDSEWIGSDGYIDWVVESQGSLLGWADEEIEGRFDYVSQRVYEDSCLREIKGGDDLINTDTTEPINAEVKA